ncbi:TonB-dependent receptor [Shewanella sp.]|uniref:TonB-dependent receptor n=1 Tax=Shewanella sp. TaxID=50422 RepID=UPI0025866BB5|nr:TonB-dependent receptor [Shewanella sp.]MCJ8302396.1 TonB-dependent receptor [Shewanella sp.]
MSGSNAFKRFTPRKTLASIAVASVLMMSAPAAIAADTSIVKGHIVNSDGAQLANATITLKHKTKGLVYTVETNAKGDYFLRNVPVGDYDISITKDGFTKTQESGVRVSIGQPVILDGQLMAVGLDNVERIAVTGSMIRRVDMGSSTSGVTFSQDELNTMPVDAGFENIALLAPGTAVPGGSNFNSASSFGGSSSAENAYYLNGLNITAIRTGLGSMRMPWEAISQTQIKTGAIDPEFGGAIGGVINAVSKSGDNEFHFGAEGRWDPSSLRATQDSIYQADGTIYEYGNTQQDSEEYKYIKLWASGAIIEDKLFYYGLYEPNQEDHSWSGQKNYSERERESNRWFAKLDWYITEDHSIGFMAMNNKRTWTTTTYDYDWETNQRSGDGLAAPGEDGGGLFSLNYNGYITDDFSVSAVIGRVNEDVENRVASTNPKVVDERNGRVVLGPYTDDKIVEEHYQRDQARIDFNWDLEDHAISFGVDYSSVSVDFSEDQNGIGEAQGWWTIATAGAGDRSGVAEGEDYIERRRRSTFANNDSEVTSLAYYINDSWQATDNLVINAGVRVNNFKNTVSDGRTYVEFENQIAPRLQAIYDIYGDGSSKVFATYGRYFQPVSVNMNIKQGGSQREVYDYYELDQLDSDGHPIITADGSPSRGVNTRDTYVNQQGITDPGLIASSSLKSMYSDEFTLGYQQEVFETMSAGARVIWRDLGRGVEDTDVGPILSKKLAELGIEDNVGQGSYYVLLNPGDAVNLSYDFDGDGQVDNITLSPEEMALDSMQRHYLALELTLDGQVTDDLRINSSYTLSHNWGNTEGLVKTDNNQADPGWTTSYDYGDLMDHGYGDLPNDHTHVFKFNGSYDITEEFILGFVTSISSGRPQNEFSVHPEGVDSCAPGNPWDACISRYYGHASHYDEDGNPSPRGTAGTLPWVAKIDLSLMYRTELFDGDFSIKGTVYNVLNSDTATNINEERTAYGEDGLMLNPNYGMTTERQEERYFSLVARYQF